MQTFIPHFDVKRPSGMRSGAFITNASKHWPKCFAH
jgi:hypothetical protein